MPDPKLRAEGLNVRSSIPDLCRGALRHDKEARHVREGGDQRLREGLAKIVLPRIIAYVSEGNDSQGRFIGEWIRRARLFSRWRRCLGSVSTIPRLHQKKENDGPSGGRDR